MLLLQNAVFLITVNHLKDLPDHGGLEIAFAGRSNAGKSSAINTLANRTRLAYVSKTPGRTQHINYFDLRNGCYLVDLPGYGYAKVPEAIKKHWEALLSTYLQKRSSLAGLVLVMDARHPLTPLDRQMLEWFSPTGKRIHILLTKADKLSRQQATQTLRAVREAVRTDFPACTAQLFSSLKRQGIEEAEDAIRSILGLDTPGAKPSPDEGNKKPPAKGE